MPSYSPHSVTKITRVLPRLLLSSRPSKSLFAPSSVLQRTTSRTMATASKINIAPDNTGLWGIRQEASAAQKATELLQKDMEVTTDPSGHLEQPR